MTRCSKRLTLEPLEDRTLLSTCHVTRLSDSGAGKGFRGDLRYCINKLNAEPGPDVIDFTVTGTIKLEAPLPSLADEVIIAGPGAVELVIDANQSGRVLDVNAGITAQVYNVTLTGGKANPGGGIRNAGFLTLADVVVEGNTTDFGQGNGIFNTESLLIYGSTISNNHSTVGYSKGGGIHSDGGVVGIYNSTISNNTSNGNGSSAWGGGIYNLSAVMTIESSAIINNQTTGSGGGISNRGTMTLSNVSILHNEANGGGGISNTGDLTIENCTISNNTAYAGGGGLSGHGIIRNSTIAHNTAPRGGGIHNSGELEMQNSTVSANTATERGGGIYIYSSLTPSVTLRNSTVANNQAMYAGGGVYVFDQTSYTTLDIHNTIVAGNSAGFDLGPDMKGTLTSSGYNIFSDDSELIGTTSTDMVNVDPLLGSLADNGGPTLTHALLAGSPAIEAGDNTDAPEFDQRGPGFPRIVNGTIDIGAFEVQSTGAPAVSPHAVQLGGGLFHRDTGDVQQRAPHHTVRLRIVNEQARSSHPRLLRMANGMDVAVGKVNIKRLERLMPQRFTDGFGVHVLDLIENPYMREAFPG